MLTVVDELLKVIKSKYNIQLDEKQGLIMVLDYDEGVGVGRTVYRGRKANKLFFKTSFGIFHQNKISYNEVLVILLGELSGALSELRHDLIISSLTYPNTPSRRTVSCLPTDK